MKTQSVVAWARLRFALDAIPCVVNTMCIFYSQLPYKCNDWHDHMPQEEFASSHSTTKGAPAPGFLSTKKYFRKGELVRHMSVTHGGARERCDECGKDYEILLTSLGVQF